MTDRDSRVTFDERPNKRQKTQDNSYYINQLNEYKKNLFSDNKEDQNTFMGKYEDENAFSKEWALFWENIPADNLTSDITNFFDSYLYFMAIKLNNEQNIDIINKMDHENFLFKICEVPLDWNQQLELSDPKTNTPSYIIKLSRFSVYFSVINSMNLHFNLVQTIVDADSQGKLDWHQGDSPAFIGLLFANTNTHQTAKVYNETMYAILLDPKYIKKWVFNAIKDLSLNKKHEGIFDLLHNEIPEQTKKILLLINRFKVLDHQSQEAQNLQKEFNTICQEVAKKLWHLRSVFPLYEGIFELFAIECIKTHSEYFSFLDTLTSEQQKILLLHALSSGHFAYNPTFEEVLAVRCENASLAQKSQDVVATLTTRALRSEQPMSTLCSKERVLLFNRLSNERISDCLNDMVSSNQCPAYLNARQRKVLVESLETDLPQDFKKSDVKNTIEKIITQRF